MTQTDMTDDLAHLRALAEAGRDSPLLNGPILIAAAAIFGTASVFQWVIQTGRWAVDPMAQLWVWVASGVAFAIALFILARRAERKPGFGSNANRVVGLAWSGLGFGIFVMWVSLMAIGFTTGDWVVMSAMPSLVATTYGTAWIICGGMARARWMTWTGVLAYGGAVLCGLTMGTEAMYLVFAAFLVATALVPGVILARGEPRAAV